MNDLDLLDKRIENYVHKRMSEDERTAFENEIKSDEKLRKDIKELIALIELYNTELFELKKKLDLAEEELEQERFFEREGEK